MPLSRRAWTRAGLGVLAAAALAPGWEATLVPVEHDEVLAAAAQAPSAFGVVRPGRGRGDEWHAQYLGGGFARLLADVGLRGAVPSLVPPDFAAHVPGPVGAQRVATRADGYFRVDARWRWPWWRPGGGVRWE
jgi:hypothetical protein